MKGWFPKKNNLTWSEFKNKYNIKPTKKCIENKIKYLIKNNLNYRKTIKYFGFAPVSIYSFVNIYNRFHGSYIPVFYYNKRRTICDIDKLARRSVQRIYKYYMECGIGKTIKMFCLPKKIIKYIIKYCIKNEYDFEYDKNKSNARIHRYSIIVKDLIKNNFDYNYIYIKYNLKPSTLTRYIGRFNVSYKTHIPPYVDMKGYINDKCNTKLFKKLKKSYYENNRNIEQTAKECHISVKLLKKVKSYFHLIEGEPV